MSLPLPNTRFSIKKTPEKGRAYRYGFNGKELDKEGMGGGASTYDYGFRIYNSALAKFLSVDPLCHKFAFYSVYQYAGNKPIVAIDLDGLEDVWIHEYLTADGKTQQLVFYKGTPEYDVWKQNVCEVLHLNPKDIPAEGIFTTRQEWSGDGVTFELRTTITPPCVIEANHTFTAGISKLYNQTMTSAVEGLGYYSDARNGYELEGAIQSAALGAEYKMKVQNSEFNLSIGLYSTNENTVGGFFKLSIDQKLTTSTDLSARPSSEVGFFFEASSSNEFSAEKVGIQESYTSETEVTLPLRPGFNVTYKESKNLKDGNTDRSYKFSTNTTPGGETGVHHKLEITEKTVER